MPSIYSYQESIELIHMPKYILDEHGKNCNEKLLNIVPGMRESLFLKSIDGEFEFKWTINNSTKDFCRFSLHVQEKETFVGLFRVDYVPDTESHPNPEGLTNEVPDCLRKYASMVIYGPHAHFNVRGYKELTWAVPLDDIGDLQKSILNVDDNVDLSLPVRTFANYIQIRTPIKIQDAII